MLTPKAGHVIEVDGSSQRGSSEGHPFPEESPAHDAVSNGKVEATFRHLQARVRTIECALEARLCQRVPEGHPSLPWLIRHASCVKNRLAVGGDWKQVTKE